MAAFKMAPNCFCLDVLIPWNPGQCVCFHIRFSQAVVNGEIELSKLGNTPMSGGVQLSRCQDIGQKVLSEYEVKVLQYKYS